MEKNEAQISGFAVVKKAPENSFFFKKIKIFPAYLYRYDLQNSERKFLKNKWVLRYLTFGDFSFLKNCSSP